MRYNFNDELTDKLYEAILKLETKEECALFLEDLCTIPEIKALAQRLEVARCLERQEIYSEIAAKTGASTATISRVSRCINYGSGGYKIILGRLEDK